ncbi:MAG: FG-GAP repeat protein, partial [Nitrospirota bacterium]|nr:FG-GAP repeat protein [Nitrospirota bacterium]
ANRNFGGYVSIAGDILAVSARLEDSNATGINGDQGNSNAPDSGAVYLFARSGGTWTQQAYLKASNTNAGDQFGEEIMLSGNTNTLVVGAPHEASSATGVNGNQLDNSALNSGAAYVFQW